MSRFEIGQKVTYSPNGETYTIAAAAPDSAGCIAVLNDKGRYVSVHEGVLETIPVVRDSNAVWHRDDFGFWCSRPESAPAPPPWRRVGTLSMMSDGTVRFEAES